jgi:hypothetical protein
LVFLVIAKKLFFLISLYSAWERSSTVVILSNRAFFALAASFWASMALASRACEAATDLCTNLFFSSS